VAESLVIAETTSWPPARRMTTVDMIAPCSTRITVPSSWFLALSLMMATLSEPGPQGRGSYNHGVYATRVTRHIAASRAAVYGALPVGRSVAKWRAPTGMTCEVREFDGREGGTFRCGREIETGGR
jgi:hypothetical protein